MLPRKLRIVLERVRKWSEGKKAPIVLLAGLGISIVVITLTATTIIYTSTEEFCNSTCHEMTTNVAMEYKGTVHDKNRTGVRATCPDCHIPHSQIPLYVRKMGRKTSQTFEDYRVIVETRPPEIIANIAICLIHQTNYLLDQQLRHLEQDFIQNGGLREAMTRTRINHRNKS